jgi:anti-sigma B factor antagonist
MPQYSFEGPVFRVEREALSDDRALLRLHGDLDLFTERQLRQACAAAAAAGFRDLIIDLGEVGFIDSAGISAIIGVYKRLRGKGTICVVASDRAHRLALDIVQLSRIIPSYESLSEALGRDVAGRRPG